MFIFFNFYIVLFWLHGTFCSSDETSTPSLSKPLEEAHFLTEDTYSDNYYCQANSPSPASYNVLKNARLLSVHLLTRHGDRTPIYLFPQGTKIYSPWTCPSEDNLFGIKQSAFAKYSPAYMNKCSDDYCGISNYEDVAWSGNCTLGQLTVKGANQLYSLGVNLRELYFNKLDLTGPNVTNIDKYIYSRSTDYWRTKQSAASLLSGLLNKTYSGSIKVTDKSFETIAPYQSRCPLLEKVEQNITSSEPFKKMLINFHKYELVYKRFLNGTIPSDNSYSQIGPLLDVVASRRCNKFENICDGEGKCIDDDIFNILMSFSNQETRLLFRDHFLNIPVGARLRIGSLLLEIKRNILLEISKDTGFSHNLVKKDHEDIKNAINSQFKFYYYSAHDTTINSILGAYSSIESKWAPYASNFIWELYNYPQNKDSNDPQQILQTEYYIRLLYNGDNLVNPWCDNRPDEGFCSVSSFLKYMDYVLGIYGGFESYLNTTEQSSLTVWNRERECNSQLE